MKCIIIDDEKPAINLIREYSKTFENIEIVGEYLNGFEGLKPINELKPDLIFLDIQMPKLNGFEMLELLDYQPKIIFTTAYQEFAVKAFDKNAIDYLLKPFSKERFIAAVKKAEQQALVDSDLRDKVHELKKNVFPGKKANRIVVKQGDKILIVPVSDIVSIEAASDYSVINTMSNSWVKSSTLKQFEEILPDETFIRVHRSSIVNINHVKEIQLYTKDTHSLIMQNGKSIKTSRNGSLELRRVLEF
jgi:two-component system, LytTR family, response regulator